MNGDRNMETTRGASVAAHPPAAVASPPGGKGRVLIVDDEEALRKALGRYLGSEGFEVVVIGDAVEGLTAAMEPNVDVALFDIRMPNLSGLDLLRAIKQRNPEVEVVIMTGAASVQTAIEAVRGGAYDYLTKPFENLEAVARVVQRAIDRRRLVTHNRALQEQVRSQQAQIGSGEMLGQAASMKAVFRLINSVGPTQATVLITGESGTGKELVARALHERSPRRGKPFLAVNCSALSETLLESELFGHEKGAFTGAVRDNKGVFETADGGTLFLDEVGDMALATQVRLLRAVQQGEIKPVGSSQTVKVDVRIVAATNVDLPKAVAEGRFREDLFYRLNVIPLPLPPLRERGEDIPVLAYHFLRRQALRHGKGNLRFEPEVISVLGRYDWPGNVRELENLIERLAILAESELISAGALPSGMGGGAGGVPREVDQTTLAHLPLSQAKALAMRAFERRYLAAVLERSGGVISAAARAAGVDRSNFRRLLRQADVAVGNGGDAEGDGDLSAEEGAPATGVPPSKAADDA
jgi:DNA-binding NtrC family response regulator